MAESVKAGRIIEMDSLPSISDGTAGGIEPDSITFELCQRLVDLWVTVSEPKIINAMHLMLEHHHRVIEGLFSQSVDWNSILFTSVAVFSLSILVLSTLCVTRFQQQK